MLMDSGNISCRNKSTQSWQNLGLLTACSWECGFLNPEVLRCDACPRARSRSTLEIDHVTVHPIFIGILRTVDNSQIVIWNGAAEISSTPRFVVAVALLSHLTSPREGAGVSVCPAADPWKKDSSEPGDRLPSVAEGVQGPIPILAIVALPEPCHCRVLHRGSTLSIHSNVIPSHPERGIPSIVIPSPPPTLVLAKGLFRARVVKVAPVVLSRILCPVACITICIPRVLKMLKVVHITSTICSLSTCTIMAMHHPHVRKTRCLVGLVRFLIVRDESIRVERRIVLPRGFALSSQGIWEERVGRT